MRDLMPRVLVPADRGDRRGHRDHGPVRVHRPGRRADAGRPAARGRARGARRRRVDRARASTKLARGRREVARETINALAAAPDLIAHDAAPPPAGPAARRGRRARGQTRRQAFGTGAATAIILLATGAAALSLRHRPVTRCSALVAARPRRTAGRAAAGRAAAQGVAGGQERACVRRAERPEQPRGKRIRLENVDVRWPGATEPTLRDLHLNIEPGTHVAIVGPSGAASRRCSRCSWASCRPNAASSSCPGRPGARRSRCWSARP